MANGTFNLNVKAKADLTELSKLKSELQNIRTLAKDIDFTGDLDPNEINAMTNAALQLEKALDAAFDVNLNTVSIQKFNDYLRKSGLSLKDIQADLAKAGAVGQQAFINTTANILQMNTAVRKSNEFLDKMATTMANTVRWSITSSILNAVVRSVEQATYYIKDLDTGLNDIRIVTGKSADEMARFAVEANNAAKALAVSTSDYTEGSLIYYQQGLDDETVKTLTEITAKTSNVTGQSMSTVSEQLTAVWNGYQVANEAAMEGMQVYEEYVDKMAAVGAATASDLEELATAMSKVASAANTMGVDFDQLSAQIATIVSVTRQAPETVGTALKTIYARLGDLKVEGGMDEFGVTLGEVSGQLEQVGIQVMDQSGNMRDVGMVMEEVAAKWGTWNEAQQQSIAIAIAGKRQYNNLFALFENWDMYTETLNTAAGAAGTLEEQQNTALESLANKMDVLRATAEDLYDNLFDEESMIDLVDAFTGFVQVAADATDALGGLKNILPLIGSLGVQVFSKQITNAIVDFKTNLNITRNEAEKTAQSIAALRELFPKIDFVTGSGGSVDSLNKGVNDLIQYYTKYSELRQYMSTDDEKIFNSILNQKAELANMNIVLDEQIKNWKQNAQAAQVFKVKISKTNDGWRGLEKLKTVTSEYNSELSKLNIKLITVERKYNNLNEHTKAVNSAFTTFFNTLKSKGNFNEAGIESLRVKIKGMIDEAAQKGNLDGTKLQGLLNILKQYSQSGGDIANIIKQIDALEGRINSLDKGFASKIDFQRLTNNIVNTVSALGRLASAWQTVQNLGDIWNDETLTDGEKFTQILINISFVFPTVLNSLKMLNTTFKLTTVLTTGWTVANAAATKGLGLMTAAQYGLNAAMRANPVGFFITAISALVGVIGIAVKTFDAIHTSAEEANEALSESIDKYKEVENELGNLNNKLDDANTRLKELYAIAKEDLTIADKEEIATLEAQNAALAAQIELQEQKRALAQREAIEKGNQSLDKGNFALDKDMSRFYISGTDGADYANFTGSEEEYQRALELIKTYSGNRQIVKQTKDGFGNWQTGSKYYTEEEALKLAEEQRTKYLTNLSNNYQTIITDGLLQAYYDNNIGGIYDEQIAQLEQFVKEYYNASGKLNSISATAVQGVFGSNASMQSVFSSVLNSGNRDEESIKDNFVSVLGKQGGEEAFDKLQGKARKLGLSMYDLIDAAEKAEVTIGEIGQTGRKSFADTVSETQKLHDGLELINEVYKDVKDGGAIDYSNFLNNKNFTEAFGNLDAYEEFIQVISSSPDDIEACQDAFNKLTSEYIENSGALENLSEDTRDVTIALLEQKGVANAEEVVDFYLNAAAGMDELTEAKKKAGYEAKTLESLTAAEIVAILNEGVASDYARGELYKLYLTQALLNENPADTRESLISLQNLVGGASAAGTALTELIEIMALLEDAESRLKTAKTKKDKDSINKEILELQSQADGIKEKAQAAFNEGIDAAVGIDIEFKGYDDAKGKKSKKELKEYIDEFDRYWEISKAIDAVTESLEDLNKIQEHTFGQELIENLKKENDLLDKQTEQYRELLNLQVQEAGELQYILGNFGVSFSADGAISNYASITQSMLAQYNSMITQLNSGSITEETFEDWETNYYEKFKDAIERYDELFYSEMVETQNQFDEIFYEKLANNLEAWEVGIELSLETAEAEREWSDFLKEINDDFKATYRDIGKEFANIFEHLDTYSRSGGTIATNIQALKDVQDAIATMQAGGSSDMFASVSEAEEKAKELKETLMEDVESVHGLWVNAWDAYMEGIDQASSKFDDLMSKFETIDEELEYQGELIELLYGTQAYELMDSLYDAQINNSLVQVDSLKQQANMWKELYDNAEEGSEEQTKYYEEWQEAQSNLNDAVVEHINLLKKDYNNTLDNILDKLEKDMTGGLGLDEMRENWEEVTAAAEKYYDATERIYELETLENKFQEAINNTSSLENQQKLKALMDDQLADLKAKEKLTEYDITLAEKRLEIAQAEMALEDARNAKNSMKLVRGASGNWEYQYVADEDDIAAKQQEMLDAYNNLYQFVKETQQESIESILNMTEQFFTKMNEIRNDDTLNEEQKMLKMEELREQYYGENGKITILQAEHAKYTEDLNIANAELLWGLYKADETNYGLMTEAQKVLIDDFINHSIEDYYALDQYVTGTYDELQDKLEESTSESLVTWNSAAAEMADAWNADDGVSVKAQVTEAFEEMQSALEEYEEGIETLEDTADTSFDNLVTDIESAIDATNDLRDATEDLCDESIDALNDYKSKINEVEDAWYDVRDAVNAAMNAVGEANNSSSTNNANPTITPTAPGGGGGSGSSGGKGGSGSGGTQGGGLPTGELHIPEDEEVEDQPLFTKGQKVASAEQRRDGGVNQVRSWWWDKSGEFKTNMFYWEFGGSLDGKTIKEVKKHGDMYYYRIPLAYTNEWFREEQLVPFDTGGYTGEWDSSGRVAMLHQKELVLNADDTENILEVVQLTRDMASLTSSVGSAVMDGVKMMLYDLMGMKAPGNNIAMIPETANEENIFNITAEFPNANDVTSIREAILSLPNMASQYLSQNKK